MSITRQAFMEAINPLSRISNTIIKKLNYIESNMILKAKDYESVKDFLNEIANYHSHSFNELSDEQQEEVTQKVWNYIKKVMSPKEITEDSNNEEQVEQKIYEFLKTTGGILYPLEQSAKKLAHHICSKKDS